MDNEIQSNVTIENAKLSYDFFEAVIENALDTLTAFSARIIATNGELALKFMAECADVELYTAELLRRIEQVGGRTETDYEDGVWYCTLTLPEGGGV